MGFFSSLFSSDDENEVKLLTAFYYVLTSCAVMKVLDENETGKETKTLNTRQAVADLGLFKTITSETEQKIAEKTQNDILSSNFDMVSTIKTQMKVIADSSSDALGGLANILKKINNIATDGNHEQLNNLMEYIIAFLPDAD